MLHAMTGPLTSPSVLPGIRAPGLPRTEDGTTPLTDPVPGTDSGASLLGDAIGVTIKGIQDTPSLDARAISPEGGSPLGITLSHAGRAT